MKLKKRGIFVLFLLAAIIILISFVSAQSSSFANVSFCCEKTTSGAWCQNAPGADCLDGFKKVPTSCDSTSFCKPGCCFDSSEGTCMENTPQKVCNLKNGTYADSPSCDIPQCNLGCCIIGDQAAYVTLTRCKKLSSDYGLQTDFRKNINSELACVSLSKGTEKGACVFDEDFAKTCKFTTRADCEGMKTKKFANVTTSNVVFYKDLLCSNENLSTNCGPSTKTTCVDGKDEVYFLDTCGNVANIYDSGKIEDKAYWNKVVSKNASCNIDKKGNANSPTCGNCDYFSGSFCRPASGTDADPTVGDNICRDLTCYNTADGKTYNHGESWCIFDAGSGKGKDPAGSRYWKHTCIAGEEVVEPCADYRTEICIQDKITTSSGSFQQAACRPNRWKDCTAQTKQEDCENQDQRDCMWLTGLTGIPGTNSAANGTSEDSKKETTAKKNEPYNVCVPNYPPGLNFWTAGDSQVQCGQASAYCLVQFEKGIIFSKKKCTVNCDCLDDSWSNKRETMCQALGDCSPGTEGVYKYLESGTFGVSGTKIIAAIADKALEKNSLNKGLLGA